MTALKRKVYRAEFAVDGNDTETAKSIFFGRWRANGYVPIAGSLKIYLMAIGDRYDQTILSARFIYVGVKKAATIELVHFVNGQPSSYTSSASPATQD